MGVSNITEGHYCVFFSLLFFFGGGLVLDTETACNTLHHMCILKLPLNDLMCLEYTSVPVSQDIKP